MKLFALFAFLSCCGCAWTQAEPDTLVAGDWVYIPNHFYHEYGENFLTWKDNRLPLTFSAVLYDRWGEIVLETTDPQFSFDHFGEEEQECFEVYLLLLKFSVPGREAPFEVRKEVVYMGYYCAG